VIHVDDLFNPDGQYRYVNGWNPAAFIAFFIAVLPNLPGFLATAFPVAFASVPDFFKQIYSYAWFIGLFVSILIYLPLMSATRQRLAQSLSYERI